MYSRNYDKRLFTESSVIWVVFIHSDLSGKYKDIIDVPKNEMSVHEFDNKKSLNEYMYVINSINDESIQATFHYMIMEQNIKLSTKYTNKVQELNL